MTSLEELRQQLVKSEREFLRTLLPFAGAAIGFGLVFFGSLSLGEVTELNVILGTLLVLVTLYLIWTFGPQVKLAHRQYREAQAALPTCGDCDGDVCCQE